MNNYVYLLEYEFLAALNPIIIESIPDQVSW